MMMTACAMLACSDTYWKSEKLPSQWVGFSASRTPNKRVTLGFIGKVAHQPLYICSNCGKLCTNFDVVLPKPFSFRGLCPLTPTRGSAYGPRFLSPPLWCKVEPLRLRRYKWKSVEVGVSRREMGHFDRIFQTEGDVAPPTTLGVRKLEWLPFLVVSKYPQCIVRFAAKHVCDRQTDGRTDRRTELRLPRPR